nr:transposon Ty3-I Gag-Pol polyprotein [Tanacetum cinerariifolium]
MMWTLHTKSKTLVTLVASPKEFQAEKKKTGVSYALVVKGVEDVMENAIPAAVKPLLAEFGKTVADDMLVTLPLLRNIQHQIDLSKKTTLLVSISNEVLGFDSIKKLYASDEDFSNILMELETKQHRDFVLGLPRIQEEVDYMFVVVESIMEDFSNDLDGQHLADENIYEFHFEDMNEGKHSMTSSSKVRGNDKDMIQELTEEYMDHLERDK